MAEKNKDEDPVFDPEAMKEALKGAFQKADQDREEAMRKARDNAQPNKDGEGKLEPIGVHIPGTEKRVLFKKKR